LLAVVALLVWTWRRCGPGHPARAAAAASMFFMLTEAAVGAGLVLFQLVADNASMARALFMAVHLMNTFLLLAGIALTAWWLADGRAPELAGRVPAALAAAAGGGAILLVGTSGAVAALGNTLFPSSSLSAALEADLSATSHLLIRLRVLHPVLAVLTAMALMFGAPRFARGRGATAERLSRFVAATAGLQVAAGFASVVLLAPVWLQLVHLLLADALWISFVLLSAQVLAAAPAPVRAPAARQFVAAGSS
jgi:heme A synthase